MPLSISSDAAQIIAEIRDPAREEILLGAIAESDDVLLVVATTHGISGHAEWRKRDPRVNLALRGFSLGVRKGELAFFYRRSELNSEPLLDYVLEHELAAEILSLLPLPKADDFRMFPD